MWPRLAECKWNNQSILSDKVQRTSCFSNNVRAFKRLKARVVSPIESLKLRFMLRRRMGSPQLPPNTGFHRLKASQSIPVKIAPVFKFADEMDHHARFVVPKCNISLLDIGQQIVQLSHLKRGQCVAGRLCRPRKMVGTC